MEVFMKFFVLLAMTVLFAPIQAYAVTCYDCPSVPEPVSLSLLAIGLGGMGAAELIRRRNKKDQ
jgi:hypothetical protein